MSTIGWIRQVRLQDFFGINEGKDASGQFRNQGSEEIFESR
jgi:hypothetical protein